MSKAHYALKIVLVSLVFISLNIAALNLLGVTVTWTHVGILVGVLAMADVAFITLTGRPSRRHTKAHADTSQGTN